MIYATLFSPGITILVKYVRRKADILNTHHIVYRSVMEDRDRADNLITVCTDCHTHENHQKGSNLLEVDA